MEITVDNSGNVQVSDNGHYHLAVINREEREYPGSKIPRYEIINANTGAVEGRIANLSMALIVMNECDHRVQEILENGLVDPDEETVGVPVDQDLGSTHH